MPKTIIPAMVLVLAATSVSAKTETGTLSRSEGKREQNGIVLACGIDFEHSPRVVYLDADDVRLHVGVSIEVAAEYNVAGKVVMSALKPDAGHWPIEEITMTGFGDAIDRNNSSSPCEE